jgi:hypothetical protein
MMGQCGHGRAETRPTAADGEYRQLNKQFVTNPAI